MKKSIFIFLFNLVLCNSFAYSSDFVIKLASYTNKENLIKLIDRLDTSLKEKIIMKQEDRLFKLFSQKIQNYDEAQYLLSNYQKIFSDAYIMKNPHIKKEGEPDNIMAVLQKDSLYDDDNTTIAPIDSILEPQNQSRTPLAFHELIDNKTFYLCPEHITAPSEKILIKADFHDNNVSYTTLIGSMPHLNMRYIIKANRLYIVNHNKVSISQFSTIDKIFFEYMIVSRWYKGKKIHQMRYYKKEADARSYIDAIHLD